MPGPLSNDFLQLHDTGGVNGEGGCRIEMQNLAIVKD